MFFHIFIFIVSCVLLFISCNWLISSLLRMAKFLGWREFVVAFFIMAIAGTIPNLFVGISSAIHNVPQISLGDIVGGNLIDLTLVVALAALFAGSLPAKSKMIQTSAIFTIVVAVLPMLLILDGILGRGDGIVLILCFFLYVYWLFSKKERFTKIYNNQEMEPAKEISSFFKDLGRIILAMIILLLAAEGIVNAASFFAGNFNLSLGLVGILFVSFGNALPEIYFTIASARKGKNWMILGNLMGSIIIPVTLVLGVVALICPIQITHFSPFAIGRFFLIISAMFFLFFIRTDRQITRKEGCFLLSFYILFIIAELQFG